MILEKSEAIVIYKSMIALISVHAYAAMIKIKGRTHGVISVTSSRPHDSVVVFWNSGGILRDQDFEHHASWADFAKFYGVPV
jgi:hypothetical protein